MTFFLFYKLNASTRQYIVTKSVRKKKMCGWLNIWDVKIFIFGWTIPLSNCAVKFWQTPLLSCEPSSASHSSIAGGKKKTFYISLPTATKTLEKALEEFLPFLPPTGQEYEVHIVFKANI